MMVAGKRFITTKVDCPGCGQAVVLDVPLSDSERQLAGKLSVPAHNGAEHGCPSCGCSALPCPGSGRLAYGLHREAVDGSTRTWTRTFWV